MRPSVSSSVSSGGKTESSRREEEASQDDPAGWSVCYQDSSQLSESGLFCRICHCGEGEGERLISPCHCSGTVGLVHRSCIEKWLSSVNKDSCELCHQKYRVSRHSRPFSSWLLTPAVGDDQRNLMGDTVCFLLLTPLTTISAYLCASGASYYFQQIKKSEAVGLLALASMLIFIYLIWLLLTIRYHFQVWFKWRVNNQDIRLVDSFLSSSNKPVSALTSPRNQRILDLSLQNQVFRHIDSLPTGTNQRPSLSSSESQSEEKEVEDPQEPEIPEPPGDCLNNVPLTPTVIHQDPQRNSVTRAVKTTKESVVYVQCPLPQSQLQDLSGNTQYSPLQDSPAGDNGSCSTID
jgi:hypothetical protein